MSFLEIDDMQEADEHKGKLNVVPYTVHEAFRAQRASETLFTFCPCRSCHPGDVFRPYEVHFSLEIICEPAVPIKVIDVRCAAQVSSAVIVAHLREHLLILISKCQNGKLPSGAQTFASPHLFNSAEYLLRLQKQPQFI